ncbi:hypothetical protein [Paenibacillus glycinis]|uniref:LysM domain-containing protein n=1 Tax=Paenibacillus glycinis TaxID=2697035 RepID=A0ABW9XPL0_9BACL|nr:hypothetical protein [Paenibacillus glycinis]NBD24356.1 hypothetical protein [Paenibacillus glycinis]
MKMNKTMKALTVAAALAVMIPLSAYAAANTTTPAATDGANASSGTVTIHKGKALAPKDGQAGFRGGIIGQEVLDLLKLDAKTLKGKLAAGKTLAQVAEEQGVSRDDLKKAMTAAFDKRQAEQKQQFADNLDKTLDGQLPLDRPKGMAGGKGFGVGIGKLDLTASAKLLGLSEADLKKELESGKSLADVAKEKGVDAQTLIDAQKKSIVDGLTAAVKAGKLTQEQADKAIANAGVIAEKFVNGTHPKDGRFPRMHKGGKHAADGQAAGDAADTEASSEAGQSTGA